MFQLFSQAETLCKTDLKTGKAQKAEDERIRYVRMKKKS